VVVDLDIFVLDSFLGTNDEPPEHYCPSYHTWNVYQLALDFRTSSQQLEVTTRLTQNYCTLLSRFGNFPTLCLTDITTILMQCDGNYRWELIQLIIH
jgi:hypothetical protein